MATATKTTSKKKTAAKKSAAKKTSNTAKKASAKKDNPCWDGYEPTPGKKPGTKGSCKPE